MRLYLIASLLIFHLTRIVSTVTDLFWFFREIAAASGEWVNEFIPNNGKKKTSAKLYVPSTAELLKRNIKRSWTISSEYQN